MSPSEPVLATSRGVVMAGPQKRIGIYLEVGGKRAFAGAVDWPGWCRSGRDEASAQQALFDYGPRYERALRSSRLGFRAPADASEFVVVERLRGDSTTDFGAPGAAPSADSQHVREEDLQRFGVVLKACWGALDSAAEKASGKRLRKGPRGGGRSLDGIVEHVVEAEGAYLRSIGWKLEPLGKMRIAEKVGRTRREIFKGLESAAHGELATVGPRGGKMWTPRYFVRRVAWHALDHAWEIEDRVE